MSARACQLCGKPLSRIRVGTDGEFCSREHRNQFRLRQGMDRLMEANNVASLMRRRERPKNIVPNPADNPSSLEHRGFSQGPAIPVRPGVVMRSAHLSVGPGNGLGHVSHTQIALVRFHVLGSDDARHSMNVAPKSSRGLFLLPNPRRGGRSGSDRTMAPAREVSLAPHPGVMLRVSGSAAFRLPRVQVRQLMPAHSSNTIRAGFKDLADVPFSRPLEPRATGEQWSALRTSLHVTAPRFAFYAPWGGARAGLRQISGPDTAAAIPPVPVAPRVAQVRIELQESMRYAISSEEDRP